MLNGFDYSRYQGQVNFQGMKDAFQFGIAKASEGCPDPGETVQQYMDGMFIKNRDGMRSIGILRGFYHFARPDFNEPEAEAQEFVNAVGGFQDDEVAALDLEVYVVKSGIDIVQWALRWLEEFERLTGNKALIYLNESTIKGHDWSPVYNADHGLWAAKYGANDGTVNPIDTGIWPTAAIYQFTSKGSGDGMGPLDLDQFYGDAATWAKYGYRAPFETPTTTTTTTVEPVTTTTTTTEAPPEVSTTGVIDSPDVPPITTTSTTTAIMDDTTTTTTTVAVSPVGTLTPAQWKKTAKALVYSFFSGFFGALYLTGINYLQSGQPTDIKFLHSLAIGAITGGLNASAVFLKQLFSAN